MVAVPAATPFTTPVEDTTEATPVLPLVQTPLGAAILLWLMLHQVVFATPVLPLVQTPLGVALAKVVLLPSHTVDEPVIAPTTGYALTVTVEKPDIAFVQVVVVFVACTV